MNFFFFLDHNNLSSSVDIFNLSPNQKFCTHDIVDIYPYAFYSDGYKWIFFELNKIKKNESTIIKKTDLPSKFQNQSIFISFSLEPNSFEKSLKNNNYMKSSPVWRSNTKIFNNFTSSSYQGEYPGSFISKNLSLVSCSPMIQNNYDTFFYLINLTDNPIKKKFQIKVMNINFEKLGLLDCYTNTVNYFNLKSLGHKFTDDFYIFKSIEFGGIPLYFTKSPDSKKMGIEHTHPPMEYIFLGNRNHFQKLKKRYWLSENKF